MNRWPLVTLSLFSSHMFSAQGKTGRIHLQPRIIEIEEGAIQNAGCGTEIWHGGPSNGETRLVKTAVSVSEYAVNSMIRVTWADYEGQEGEFLFEKMDPNFENCIQYGQKLDIGCFVTSTNHGITIDGGLCAYPLYVHEALQKSEQKDIKYTTYTLRRLDRDRPFASWTPSPRYVNALDLKVVWRGNEARPA